jgi:phosphatidylglycerophosphate synthase
MQFSYKDIDKAFHNKEPWINIFLFKFITKPVVWIVANYTNITPDALSIFSLCLGIVAMHFYINGNYLIGAIIYVFSYLCDAMDGKIARLKKTGKIYGGWIDIVIDRVVLGGILFSYAYSVNSNIIWIFSYIFIICLLIGNESSSYIRLYSLKKINDVKSAQYISENVLTGKTCSNRFGEIYKSFLKKYNILSLPVSLTEVQLIVIIVGPNTRYMKEILIISSLYLTLRFTLLPFLYWKKELNNNKSIIK